MATAALAFNASGDKSDSPLLDLVHLARQSAGDRDLEAELLNLFHRQAELAMTRLADCAASEPKARRDLAHTLRGSASAIGATHVARAAKDYEDHLGVDAEKAATALIRLRAALRDTCDAVERLTA